MKVFALPYAGGSAMMYQSWKINKDNIEFITIDYAGHGFRFKEALDESFSSMLDDVYLQIVPLIDEDEYILLGHSMGGLVGWYIAQRVIAEGHRKPKALIVSATLPPDQYPIENLKELQDADKLEKYIEKYNRIPEKRRKNRIYIENIFPSIRNDFEIISKYKDYSVDTLDIPIYCFYANADTLVNCSRINEWCARSRSVSFYKIEGDHFYIEETDAQKEIVDLIKYIYSKKEI